MATWNWTVTAATPQGQSIVVSFTANDGTTTKNLSATVGGDWTATAIRQACLQVLKDAVDADAAAARALTLAGLLVGQTGTVTL